MLSSPYGWGRVVADGPELIAGSDDVREMRWDAMRANYKHACLSTVKSRDQHQTDGSDGPSPTLHRGQFWLTLTLTL